MTVRQLNLFLTLEKILLEPDAGKKAEMAIQLKKDWDSQSFEILDDSPIRELEQPGKPDLPRLVDPRSLPRRNSSSVEGRVNLIHAFAHIEFNAINIALDAVYRFRHMPYQYQDDWILVASDEARHFNLLNDHLKSLGSDYGDCDAHSGLWDMVCKTRHDCLHRMALVPRVMEARGLDVTPTMINKFNQAGDDKTVEILQIIYKDEINHVRIGNYWYQFLCDKNSVDAQSTFVELIDEYLGGQLRGPFNFEARVEAGFTSAELSFLENR